MNNNVRMSQLTRGLVAVAIVGSGLATYHNEAVAAISASRHNLSATAGNGNRTTGAGSEICVFCHTPHGADVSVAGAPLWNKRFTSGFGAAFTPYVATTTLDGAFATDGTGTGGFLSGASLACLSCHDGTQAIDNLLNAPGSGGIDAIGGDSGGRAFVWTLGNNSNLNAAGYLSGNANLGKDLSNDHPIGIRYCGGGPVVSAPGTACADPDFVSPSSATIGTTTQFWVNTTGAGGGTGNQREKFDMLLYNRNFAAGGSGPSVECASCHDVHSSATLFLRMGSNNSSQICLACHVK
jgi:predicted CXXCH cytochrome family protein